jgi:hypothetical protein
MLTRAIKAMVPDGDFSTSGAPTFKDQKSISSWALQDVLFVSKNGIMSGSNSNFMPRATTTAQKAAGYGMTTREQALAMSVRTYELEKPATAQSKPDSKETSSNKSESIQSSTPPKQPATGTETVQGAQGTQGGPDQRLAGTWWVKDSGIHMVIVMSFKSDGTFKKSLAIYSSISNYAEVTNGSYKIDGNKITYCNQTYGSAKGYWKNSALPGYAELGTIFVDGNLPTDDKTESISFTDDNHVMLGGLEMTRAS